MTYKSIVITIATFIALTVAAMAQSVEIRLCETNIYTYPLSEERGVQSALLQSFAIVNEGDYPVKLTGISFNLKDKQQVMNSSWLLPADISNSAKQSPQIGMLG